MKNDWKRKHIYSPALWLLLGWLGLFFTGCSAGTPLALTQTPTFTPTPTLQPEKATYRFTLEKSIGQGIAQTVDWSPDGASFAIGTTLKVDLYDSSSLQVTGAIEMGQAAELVKFSPDGRLLAIALGEGSVQIWDVTQPQRLHTLSVVNLGWYPSLSWTLAFSPDSARLAVAGDKTIYLLDTGSGELIDTFPGHDDSIVALSFDTTGNILLAASSSQAFVRELSTRELLYPPIALPESAKSIMLAGTDGKFMTISSSVEYNNYLAYATFFNSWDLATGGQKSDYQVSRSLLYGVAASPKGGKIALGGDGRIDIWDASANRVVHTLKADQGWVRELAISPDGSRLISISGRGDGLPQLWDLSTYQHIHTFDEYSTRPLEVVFSPDGSLSAETDGNKIRVKEMVTGKLRYTLVGNAPLAFSPDGEILAFAKKKETEQFSSGSDGNSHLAMVRAGTGEFLPYGYFLCGGLSAIAFSPSGENVVYGGSSYQRDCLLQIRHVESGKLVLNFQKAKEDIYLSYDNLTFSPDGHRLALAGYQFTILDTENGDVLHKDDSLTRAKAAFSPDGRYLAVSGFGSYVGNEKVKVFDAATLRQLFLLETTQSKVEKMTFSPDGQVLAIAGNSIELWDAWTGQPLSKTEQITPGIITGLAFNQAGDGLWVAKDDSEFLQWRIARGERTAQLSRPTPTIIPTLTPTPAASVIEIKKVSEIGKGVSSRVFYSPDRKIAALFDGDNLAWFDSAGFKELGTIPIDSTGRNLTFSPDGKLAVVDTYFGAQIVDLQSQKIVGKVSGGNGGTYGYVFSRDSQYMAYVMADRSSGGPYYSIGLWNAATHQVVSDYEYFQTLLEYRYHVVSPPDISPNGKLVAAGHNDKRVYVWDLETGKTRFILEGHAATVSAVAFSPNGRLLASGSRDGTVRLWNAASGRLERVLTGFLNDVYDVRFTADGRSIIASIAEQPDQVVDLESGKISPAPVVETKPDPFEIRQLEQGYSTSNDTIFSAALFSPDGRILATASENVLLWDVNTRGLTAFLQNPQGGVIRGMVFSPDGSRLAVTTAACEVIVWDTRTKARIFSQKSGFLSGNTVLSGYGDSEPGWARGKSNVAEQGLAFSPDNRLLAFGNDRIIKIWDITGEQIVTSLDNPAGQYATQVSFSADGTRLYAIINRNRAAQVWEIASGKLVRQVELSKVDPNVYSAVALHGNLFARNNAEAESGAWIEIWNLETGELLKIATPSAENEPLRFSPDGSLLFTLNDGVVYFWKTATGQLVYQEKLEGVWHSGLALSPDNRYLATGRDGKTQLWDISPVAQLAQRNDIPDLRPQPTAAPAVFAWPTPTPLPTVRPGATSGGAARISPVNAAQLKEKSLFGNGLVEQAAWSADGNSVYVTGSLGVFTYTLNPTTASLVETSRLEEKGWSYDTVSLPDGRLLTAGTAENRVYVSDGLFDTNLADREGRGETALSPDGNLLAYFDQDGNLVIWDIPNEKILTTPSSYSYYSSKPVFSPDGRFVAALQTGGSRYDDSIRVWNARTGEIVNALGGPDSDITDFSFSPDGRFIAGAAGGSAWVWMMNPGARPERIDFYEVEINDNLNIYTHTVTSVALSPDNALAAIGTSENGLYLYQRQGQRKVRDLVGLNSPARQMRFSPDGKKLLSVSEDGLLTVWDVASGKLLSSRDGNMGPIGGLLFLRNGTLSAWGRGTNWVIQPGSGLLLQTTRIGKGKILAASPLGDLLAVYNPFQVSLWDAHTGLLLQTLEGEATTPFVEYYWEGQAFRQFYAASFSADGSRLATAGAGGVWIYDTSNYRLLQQFPGSNAQKLVLSPDGNTMLTALYEQLNPLSAFNLRNGDMLFSFGQRSPEVVQAAFSPDGRWAGALLRQWDAPYQLVLHSMAEQGLSKSLEFEEKLPVVSLAFNPDSSIVAVGRSDGAILIIDLDKLQVLATSTGHRGPVEYLAFSPDGQYLASGGADGTVRIWGLP